MSSRLAELTVVIVAFIAALGWILSKRAMAELPVFTFVALRFLGAALVLACFSYRAILACPRSMLVRCALTGLAMSVGLLFWALGLQRAEHVGEAAFVASLAVVLTPMASWLLFRETPGLLLWVALIPGVAGLYCLSIGQQPEIGWPSLEPAHALLLMAATAFAVHLTLTGHTVKQVPSLVLTTVQMAVVGSVATLLMLVWESPWQWWPTQQVSAVAWWCLLTSALVATSLRFALQTKALQYLSPANAGMILLLEPVLTAVLASAWLGHSMVAMQVLGCGLIFTGLIVYRGAPLLRRYSMRRDH